ncbi:MAG: thioesterase family protein [Lachnospiraceae bacterium]|nr:thioesterase family protein [bacterium]MDY5516074.1 thioesterase family protein [Lachnospiraceae bacterium]
MLETGIKGTRTVTVNEENTAKAMGSGTLEVFATPALIALMEETCWRSVANELEEGSGTVGTLLEIKHTAPTPVGMKVTCESTLTEVDGRRLVFEVIARDAKGVVGEGKHERFVIQNEKFQVKANAKLI